MGSTRVHDDDCRQRWVTEIARLRLYRRQRATVHCDQTRSLDDIVRDAGYLDRCIAITADLVDSICDEHNGHTVGTWEHAHRPAHVPVKEPA